MSQLFAARRGHLSDHANRRRSCRRRPVFESLEERAVQSSFAHATPISQLAHAAAAISTSATPATARMIMYSPYTRSYYELVLAPTTWDQANLAAQQHTYQGRHGRLATITSRLEDENVIRAFGSNLDQVWLGGVRPRSSNPVGSWSWITGEQWSYTNWASGQPDNTGRKEDRLQYYTKGGRFLGLGWNDNSGNAVARGYLVEYSA